MSSVIPSIFQQVLDLLKNIRPHSLIGMFGIHLATLIKKIRDSISTKYQSWLTRIITILLQVFLALEIGIFCKIILFRTPPPIFLIYLFSVSKLRFLLYKYFMMEYLSIYGGLNLWIKSPGNYFSQTYSIMILKVCSKHMYYFSTACMSLPAARRRLIILDGSCT